MAINLLTTRPAFYTGLIFSYLKFGKPERWRSLTLQWVALRVILTCLPVSCNRTRCSNVGADVTMRLLLVCVLQVIYWDDTHNCQMCKSGREKGLTFVESQWVIYLHPLHQTLGLKNTQIYIFRKPTVLKGFCASLCHCDTRNHQQICHYSMD